MKNKKWPLFLLAIIPLLTACSTPVTVEQGLDIASSIHNTLHTSNYQRPTRYQLVYTCDIDYKNSKDFENTKQTFVCDGDGYKIYTSTTVHSRIEGVKTKQTDVKYAWLDKDWSLHTAFENETKKAHEATPMTEESALLAFSTLALAAPHPVELTIKILENIIHFFSAAEINDDFEYSFGSNSSNQLSITRNQVDFKDAEDGLKKSELYIEIKDSLIHKGWQEIENNEYYKEISFEYTIGNVSVKLPNVSNW